MEESPWDSWTLQTVSVNCLYTFKQQKHPDLLSSLPELIMHTYWKAKIFIGQVRKINI